MVVDAQVERRPLLVAIDQERRRLFAALVSARGFAGAHRRDQALREGQRLVRDVGFRGVVQHPGAGKHVAGNREILSLDVSAPVDTFAAGMGGDAAAGVHDVKLPALVTAIRRNQGLDDVARRSPFTQQLQTVDAVIWIDQRLRRDTAKTGGDVRHAGAHCEEPCRDRNAELAGCVVSGDN